MALLLKDRVKETTTTTGTGPYTLAGAVAGFEAFSEIGDGNTTYYCCTDGTDFEVGVGTYTASGTTLARTNILQSSNGDAEVNWTSGSRTIFCTQPAEKAVFLDASGNIDIDGGAIDGVTLGTNIAVTEAQIDDININDGTIESSNSFSGLILKVNGQLIARVQSSNQSLTGGGLYLYQNNPYITFEGDTSDVYETNLKVTDPTANRDITLPDASGTVAVFSTAPTSAITDGTNGQVLTTNGSGTLSFQTVSGGGGTIASQDANNVDIDGGAIDGVTIGTNSAVSDLRVGDFRFFNNNIFGTVNDGNLIINPAGNGDINLIADTVQVGDLNTDATLTTRGTGDLTINTNSGTNTGSITIAEGEGGNISLTPHGTGSVVIDGLSYPQSDGTNGQVLTTDGSGGLSFTTVSGGGGGSGISTGKAIAMAMIFG